MARGRRRLPTEASEVPEEDDFLDEEESESDDEMDATKDGDELSHAQLHNELSRALNDLEAARNYNKKLADELKEVREDAFRSAKEVNELQQRLTTATNQDAAHKAGYDKGFADAMVRAEKSPIEAKKAVHGDKPVRARVTVKSIFVARDKLVDPPPSSDGSVKAQHGQEITFKTWDAVAQYEGKVEVV